MKCYNFYDLYTNYQVYHGGIIKTGERASYQPKNSDCTHAARLLSRYCQAIVRPLSLREVSQLSHTIEN